MKKIIVVGLLVLLAGCHTTPVKPTNEQKIENPEDTTFILADILQLFKW